MSGGLRINVVVSTSLPPEALAAEHARLGLPAPRNGRGLAGCRRSVAVSAELAARWPALFARGPVCRLVVDSRLLEASDWESSIGVRLEDALRGRLRPTRAVQRLARPSDQRLEEWLREAAL